MRYIVIDGKRYDWNELKRLRNEQLLEARRKKQLQLFELKNDSRPKSQKTASGRYEEPLLFKD
jgi:hypothetical protein